MQCDDSHRDALSVKPENTILIVLSLSGQNTRNALGVHVKSVFLFNVFLLVCDAKILIGDSVTSYSSA